MSMAPDPRRRPTFGLPDRLLKARLVAGLEQIDLAEALDVGRTTISNYERGLTTPRRPQLAAWSLATGVDLDWLQNGETPRPNGPGGVEPPNGIEPLTYSLIGARMVRRRVAAGLPSEYGTLTSAGRAA